MTEEMPLPGSKKDKIVRVFIDAENWFNAGYSKTEKLAKVGFGVLALAGIGDPSILRDNLGIVAVLGLVYLGACIGFGWGLGRLRYYHLAASWGNQRNPEFLEQLRLMRSIDHSLKSLKSARCTASR